MIEKYLVVGVVVLLCLALVAYTQFSGQNTQDKSLSFKDKLQKEFSQFKVIERNQNLIICRKLENQPVAEELILIRIDPNQQKNLRSSGKMLIATYSKQPSIREVKKDVVTYLVE